MSKISFINKLPFILGMSTLEMLIALMLYYSTIMGGISIAQKALDEATRSVHSTKTYLQL